MISLFFSFDVHWPLPVEFTLLWIKHYDVTRFQQFKSINSEYCSTDYRRSKLTLAGDGVLNNTLIPVSTTSKHSKKNPVHLKLNPST